MLRAAIYARYSSALQHPSSIDDQVALCRQSASRLGCTVLDDEIYSDSEISGSDTHREGYQRLLASARAKAFDAIIVEGQDRLWRNQAEMHAALRKLTFWGIKVFSVATGTDLTDKAGKLIATVFGWKDEAYLDDLRDKTRRGLAGRVERGLSAGGRSYGYRTLPVPDPEGRTDAHGAPLILGYRREIEEREAEVVRRIFQFFGEGHSPRGIAKQLNTERVPPPRPKQGKRPQGWTGTAIYGTPRLGTGILNNPLYAGQYVWNRFAWIRDPETGKRVPRLRPETEWVTREVPELRIVPDELWQRVKARQADIASRAQGRQGGYAGQHPRYLLSGLLRCGGCDAHYIIRSRDRYVCSFYLNRGTEICPNSLSVGRIPLERRVVDFLRDKLYTRDQVAYLVERVQEVICERLKRRREPDRESLRHALAEVDQQLANVERAILQGIFTETTGRLLKDLEARRALVTAQLEAPAVSLPALSSLPNLVERHLSQLYQTLSRNVPKAREMLRKVITEVRLNPIDLGEPSAHLEGEVVGNINGLLSLEPAYADTIGSGGPLLSIPVRQVLVA